MEIQAMQQSLESGPMMPWLTPERRNWIAAAMICGLVGYGAGNGHTTQGAVEHISKQLGAQGQILAKTKAVAACEHQAHVAATNLVVQAVVADQSPSVPAPSLSDLPKDCPSVAKK